MSGYRITRWRGAPRPVWVGMTVRALDPDLGPIQGTVTALRLAGDQLGAVEVIIPELDLCGPWELAPGTIKPNGRCELSLVVRNPTVAA